MLFAVRGKLLRILPTLSRANSTTSNIYAKLTVCSYFEYFESAHTVVNTSGDRKQVSRLPHARMTQGVSYSFRGMTARTTRAPGNRNLGHEDEPPRSAIMLPLINLRVYGCCLLSQCLTVLPLRRALFLPR